MKYTYSNLLTGHIYSFWMTIEEYFILHNRSYDEYEWILIKIENKEDTRY